VKLKLDENLPESLVGELCALGHDADNVRQEGIAGHDDAAVWSAAQEAERFLITQDLDFSDVRKFKPGTHCGLLLVRVPDAGRGELLRNIVALFKTADVESWSGCFVVQTSSKLRVIRPS
jgi:predicted nuclease of predicted toxin-antitoxin system